MKGAARCALQRELQELNAQEEFPCKITADLNKSVTSDFLPFARSEGTWARKGSWLKKFFSFAKNVCLESGKMRTEEETNPQGVGLLVPGKPIILYNNN